MTVIRTRFHFLLLMTALIVMGCDSGSSGGDTIFLRHELTEDIGGSPITLAFSADDLSTGRLQDIVCDCELDIASFLDIQGFSKSDIVSARLEAAEIVMLFPVNENVDFLDQAILKLTAPGISPTEVANTSSFPSSRTGSMNILPNRDIASFLDRPTFGLILQIDPATLRAGQDYQMSLVLDMRLEVSGI